MSKLKPLFLILLLLCFLNFYREEKIILTSTQKLDLDNYSQKQNSNDLYGVIKIPDIQIENPIYSLNSSENHVDKNIQLLNTSPLVLAAHSGTGPHAYFKSLNQLKKKSKIIFSHDEQIQIFEYIKKVEVNKTGSVTIEKYDFPFIALITCSKTDDQKQEIYYAKLVENDKN